jgi:peptide/nickel transport system ATP-binding protein
MSSKIILEINNLEMHFPAAIGYWRKNSGGIRAIDNLSLTLRRGETLGLCGESGCGKSTLALCINRLHTPTQGKIMFDGVDISHLPENKLKKIRQKMSLVFQDPYGSLDPRQRIRNIVIEPIKVLHLSKADHDGDLADRLLNMVGLDPSYANRYPHELSGGQRQRVGIARALASDPSLVILDEPLSALDVSIQAQIINLLRELHDRRKELTYIFISHDLSTIQYMSDRVAVMYLGRIVELAETDELYRNPLHPYTQMLMAAASMNDNLCKNESMLCFTQNEHPILLDRPTGCNFVDRCYRATPECGKSVPDLYEVSADHVVACRMV